MHDQNRRPLPLIIVRDGLASQDFDEPFPTLIATPEEIAAAAEEYLRRDLARRQNHKVIDGALVPKPISVRVSAAALLFALAAAGTGMALHRMSAGVAGASVIPVIYLFLVCLWRYELAHRTAK